MYLRFSFLQVNLVVNYDLLVIQNSPAEPDNEVYLHRIGRAGRFGRKGKAPYFLLYLFVCNKVPVQILTFFA